ncbi:hypothetical protein ACHAWC_011289 [Mediolabrus comicus]
MKQAADTSPTKKGARRSKRGRKAPTTDDIVAATTAATLKETDEETTTVVAAAAATITTATTVEVSSEDIRNANVASGSPISWETRNFTHAQSSKVSVAQVIRNVSEVDYTKAKNHPSGNIYLLSHEQLQNGDIQGGLLSDIIPELIKMITKKGFDVNRIEEILLEGLLEASREYFPKDYPYDDKIKVEDVGGSVYLKFIVMTVGGWISSCKHLLDGPKKFCSGKDRMFIERLLDRLEKGIEKCWWTKTDKYSVPYIGESSTQTFQERMNGKYPPLYNAIMEKSGDTPKNNFEIKVGQVNARNAVQSRALESFVAMLLSLFTEQTRRQDAKHGSDEYYVSCRCLRIDGSGLNEVICGDRIGFGKFRKRNGYEINEWFSKFTNTHRNESILSCPLRNAVIVEWVLGNQEFIIDYINTTSRELSRSTAVRMNKDAPPLPRVYAHEITLEDGSRTFSHIVGCAMLRDGKGIHDDEWKGWQQEMELEDVYNDLKEQYEDEANFSCNGYFFPVNSSRTYNQFFKIRNGKFADTDFRRGFFLSKEEFEIDHLLDNETYEELKEERYDLKNDNKEHAGVISKLRENGAMDNVDISRIPFEVDSESEIE